MHELWFEIAQSSFISILKLLLVVMTGVWLAHRGILTKEVRQGLSRMIMLLFLPCLLVVSLGRNASAENLGKWCVLMFAAPIYALAGFLAGKLSCKVLRLPDYLDSVLGTAAAFCNASYLPLPLMATLCAMVPFLGDQHGERSFAYVSIFLLVHSPMLWGLGFPSLSGKSWRELDWHKLISPPLIASMIGLSLGLIPFLRRLVIAEGAPLYVLTDAMAMTSKAVFPCALLLLGANLSEKLPRGEAVPKRAYFALVFSRLVVSPIVGLLFTLWVWRMGWVPRDPVFLMVLLVESAVPPATNLIVMTQYHRHREGDMARLLLCAYCCTIPILTCNIIVFLKIVHSLLS